MMLEDVQLKWASVVLTPVVVSWCCMTQNVQTGSVTVHGMIGATWWFEARSRTQLSPGFFTNKATK